MFSKAFYTCWGWKQLTFLGILVLLASNLSAKTQQTYITKSNSFSTEFPVANIAFSSDESLVAVTVSSHEGNSQVSIYDRQTTKPIAQIHSRTSPIQQIKFAPFTQQLAIVDPESIQLWDLSNIPTQPGKPLADDYLIQNIRHQMGADEEIQFQHQANLVWGESQNLRQWNSTNAKMMDNIWVGNEKGSLNNFSFSKDEQWVAYNHKNGKRIFIANPQQKLSKPELDYHNFPIVQLEFVQSNVLLSLDNEKNLIWGNIDNRTKMNSLFLQKLPIQETPFDFKSILYDQFLAILTQKSSNQKFAHIIDRKGNLLQSFPLESTKAFAISPTGAYLAISSTEKQVSIHQFRYHQPPEEYINFLNKNGAQEMARHYRNHLESIPQLNSSDQSLLGLQVYLDNLKVALQTEQWSDVNQWANKILLQDPENRDALEAKKLLKDHQDLMIFDQGKQEFENKNLKLAIRTLASIPTSSRYRSEARQLISLAENKLKKINTIEKVKNEIFLENWPKAKALLLPILNQNPNDPEIVALLEEIESHETSNFFVDLLIYLLILGGLGATGMLLYRSRHSLVDWLSLKEQEPSPLKPPLKPKSQTSTRPENTTEQKFFFETLEKAQNILKLTKSADKLGKYTNRLIDFEAEISVIRKKGNSANANYAQLSKNLLHIIQTLRSFNFAKEQRKQQSRNNTRQQQKQQKKEAPPSQTTPSEVINYYKILGISSNATTQEIKQSYHRKMKAYHPDLHQNSEFDWIKAEAEEKTRQIQEAYDILKNSASRQKYDRTLKNKK